MNTIEAYGSSDSEDEIFFGAVTTTERKKAKQFCNRRTVSFNAPLYVQHHSSSAAPRDDASKTYSKVPHIKRATEDERKQAIKQRPPPLPSFTQLYCSKEGQSLNSPFHLLTNTKHQTNNQSNYRSTRSVLPLPSPHMYAMHRSSRHLLTVPSQQRRRSCLSPGLSPSFFQDPFDKLLQHNGQASRAECFSSVNLTEANRCRSSCSSIEDVMSPAGLLFCSPNPIAQHKVSKKMKMQSELITRTSIKESTSSEESNEPISSTELRNDEKIQDAYDKSPSNEYVSNAQRELHANRKTPDLFYTSSWITRRHAYKKLSLAEIGNIFNMDSSPGKTRLHRTSSVPEVHIVHPEESDNSFMSPNIANSSVSSRIGKWSHGVDDTTTKKGKSSPKWLLTMASALKHSLSFSDSDLSNAGQSPMLSDLGKTFDTVSTLTPIFSKYVSHNRKPLSTTLRGIVKESMSHH